MTRSRENYAQNAVVFSAPVLCSERVKVLLHFFPNLGPLSTPSPVNCRICVFGQGKISSPVTLEGLRLSQADSVPLSTILSDFSRDYGHLAGLRIELFGTRGLQASQVFIEMRSSLGTTKYLAKMFTQPEAQEPSEQAAQAAYPGRLIPMSFDSLHLPKLIFLNPTSSATMQIGASPLAPYSVLETSCQPQAGQTGANSATASYSGMLAGARIPDSAALGFLLSCDRSTHIPVQVMSL